MQRRIGVVLVAGAILVASSPLLADTEVEGETAGGAFYKFVMPDVWNGDLVIWNHGFSLGPIEAVTDLGPLVDLQLLEGYAVAASSYRQDGWAVFKSHTDLKLMVDAFVAEFGEPSQIILFGASLGGIVTAAAIERVNLGNVVGALTMCGAMAGSRNWDGALDLRLLYDVVCADIPDAAIPGGGKGLPKNSTLTEDDVNAALNACTGILKKKSKRTRAQKRNLKKLVRLSNLPKDFLVTDIGFATFGLWNLHYAPGKLKKKQGVGNENVDYGDAKVNAEIARVKPKKKGARKLRRNYTPTGRVGDVKIVSIHTDKDGLVIVENETEYASVVSPENLTVAIAVEKKPTHCGFTAPEVVASWESLLSWISNDAQPTVTDLQLTCEGVRGLFPGKCRFDPEFELPDMDGRIRPRNPPS